MERENTSSLTSCSDMVPPGARSLWVLKPDHTKGRNNGAEYGHLPFRKQEREA